MPSKLYERNKRMMNLSEVINFLPRMKSGNKLLAALEVLPEYNNDICFADVSTRLMALSDIYKIYIPSQFQYVLCYTVLCDFVFLKFLINCEADSNQ